MVWLLHQEQQQKSQCGITNNNTGNNYRMSEIQAALGLSQMKRLGEFVKKRNELADIYSMSLQCQSNTNYLKE